MINKHLFYSEKKDYSVSNLKKCENKDCLFEGLFYIEFSKDDKKLLCGKCLYSLVRGFKKTSINEKQTKLVSMPKIEE